MTKYYLIVLLADLLYGMQFVANSKYSEGAGEGLRSTLRFMLGANITTFVIMLCICGFRVHTTLFTTMMAMAFAGINLLFLYCSMAAIGKTNLSVYSMFTMLGAMILPSALGLIFFNETLNLNKILCFVLILAALVVNMGIKGAKISIDRHCILIFFVNGVFACLSKLQSSFPAIAADSSTFMLCASFMAIVLSGSILLITRKKGPAEPLPPFKTGIWSVAFGTFNGVAEMLALIGLSHLPATVQQPMVTGGVIIVSTINSLILKSEVTRSNWIALGIAAIGMIILVL